MSGENERDEGGKKRRKNRVVREERQAGIAPE